MPRRGLIVAERTLPFGAHMMFQVMALPFLRRFETESTVRTDCVVIVAIFQW